MMKPRVRATASACILTVTEPVLQPSSRIALTTTAIRTGLLLVRPVKTSTETCQCPPAPLPASPHQRHRWYQSRNRQPLRETEPLELRPWRLLNDQEECAGLRSGAHWNRNVVAVKLVLEQPC